MIKPIAFSFFIALLAIAKPVVATAAPPVAEPRLQWFTEARFGMFVHFGIHTVAGSEWNGKRSNRDLHLQQEFRIPCAEYAKLAERFNPARFDARAWAVMARNAGAKYMVYIAKHHDGFAMYDSPSNPYNIVKATPFGRDPLKELAAACKTEGIVLCIYYSLGRDWAVPGVPFPPHFRANDWDFPQGNRADLDRYIETKVKPQLRELLTQYGPVGAIWFDTPEQVDLATSTALRQFILDLQPNCLINDRVGHRQGDYGISEQFIPGGKIDKPWESCLTINKHWGFDKFDHDWKSTDELLRHLIDITSKGGNFLLNVGPDAEGIVPEPCPTRLKEMGDWLKINGEAIYGTSATCFGNEFSKTVNTSGVDAMGQEIKPPENAPAKHAVGGKLDIARGWRCTTKPGIAYIHLLDWPGDSFKLDKCPAQAARVTWLADETPLDFIQKAGQLEIRLPARKDGIPVLKIEWNGEK
jgi:alpha-L-fucosidase